MSEPAYLTIAEAAARLRVCERTIRRAIAAGRLPALKVGAAVRIEPAALTGAVRYAVLPEDTEPGEPEPPVTPAPRSRRRGTPRSRFSQVARLRTVSPDAGSRPEGRAE